MIFDKDYDNALWLLVAGNKKDSDKICNLIRYIPEEIYLKIQMAISDYYSEKLEKVNENVIYSDVFNEIDEYCCSIIVKIKRGRLYLNLYRWKEDIERIEEEYNLILKAVSSEDLEDLLILDKNIIGKYSSEVNNIKFLGCLTDVETSSYDRKYFVKKVPFGYIVFSKFGKKKTGRKFINVIKNMPEEIFVSDFDSQDNVASLVKKRVRDK